MEPSWEDLEELLRSSRPLPRTEFVRDLEESLVRSLETPRGRPRWMRLYPGRLLALSSARAVLAAIILELSVAGALVLGVGGRRRRRRSH
jgi:hypothetical protein